MTDLRGPPPTRTERDLLLAGAVLVVFVYFSAPLFWRFLPSVVVPIRFPPVGALFVILGTCSWQARRWRRGRRLVERFGTVAPVSTRGGGRIPGGPVLRTALVLVGLAIVGLSVSALVEFNAMDFGPTDTGAGIGIAWMFLTLLVLVGAATVGLGVSIPGEGGRFTVPPAQFSPVTRLLVTDGSLMLVALPLALATVIVLDGVTTTPDVVLGLAWGMGALGVKFLVVGLVWVTVAGIGRRYLPDATDGDR